VLSIRGSFHRHDSKCGRTDHNARVFQHLRRPSFLQSPAEHLVATREGELAAVLAKKRVANHQRTSPERHDDSH
jgi:hypothetical protein